MQVSTREPRRPQDIPEEPRQRAQENTGELRRAKDGTEEPKRAQEEPRRAQEEPKSAQKNPVSLKRGQERQGGVHSNPGERMEARGGQKSTGEKGNTGQPRRTRESPGETKRAQARATAPKRL